MHLGQTVTTFTSGFFPRWACVTALVLLLAGTVSAKEPEIRVGLFTGLKDVKILLPGGGWASDARGRRLLEFKPGKPFQWQAGSRPTRKGGKGAAALIGKTVEFHGRQKLVEINGVTYRGRLRVVFAAGGAQVVNLLPLDDYVRGVVGKEIGSLSPAESLKSQSVIVRTYGLANGGKHNKDGFDVCSREHCQVYGGVAAERPSIDAAVTATRGIVMISAGKPISTLYHATCGGMTSNNEEVFGGKPVSYLRRVRCGFCQAGNKFRWVRKIPQEVLVRRLNKEGIACGTVTGAAVVAPSALDRVEKIVFQTDQGPKEVRGTTFRRFFELPSTTFVVKGAVAPAPSEPPTSAASAPVAVVDSDLSGTRVISAGPSALMVFSSAGLKRVTRPREGWKVCVAVPAAFRDSSPASLDGGKPGRVPLRERREPPAAEIVLYGRGFGHQVGLCQTGSIELGKRNWSYRQILAFYYADVALRVLKY